MSLYGINAYTSNSYYSALLANKNNSLADSLSTFNKNASNGDNISKFLKEAIKTDKDTDLQTLARKVDLARSKGYKKAMTEEYKKQFSAEKTDFKADNNEVKLAENAKLLSGCAGAMAINGREIFSDPEQAVSAIKDFAESYNSTLDGLQKSDSINALEKGVSMVNTTKAYARALSHVGVKLGSDNRLTVDEEKLKKAPEGTLRSLFSGNYSFATKIADKASYISRAADIKAQVSYNVKGNMDYYNKMAVSIMFNDNI